MTLLKRQRHEASGDDDNEPAETDAPLAHDDLPHVAALSPSALELLILEVSRCFCHGWANGDIAGWDHAFRLCEERFGPVEGATLVARVVSLMRVLLRERRTGVRYMPVHCTRICKDEEMLLRAVQSAIRGNAEGLRAAVATLTLTRRPERTATLTTVQVLGVSCHHLDLLAGPEATPSPRRTLN